MNILWVTNILFPEADALLNGSNELKSSGGWMLGLANALQKKKGINLCVASLSKKVNKLVRIEGKHISYFVIPYGKGNVNPNFKKFYETGNKLLKSPVFS